MKKLLTLLLLTTVMAGTVYGACPLPTIEDLKDSIYWGKWDQTSNMIDQDPTLAKATFNVGGSVNGGWGSGTMVTPLEYIILRGLYKDRNDVYYYLINKLIQRPDANLNTLNTNLLHEALSNNDFKLATMLIKAGANIHRKNYMGKTALEALEVKIKNAKYDTEIAALEKKLAALRAEQAEAQALQNLMLDSE